MSTASMSPSPPPGPPLSDDAVTAWLRDGALFEQYTYAPGPASSVPTHSHDEYQWSLTLDFPGEYRYRRARHAVPVGSVSVIHPGEPHNTRQLDACPHVARYLVAYVPRQRLATIAGELGGRHSDPFFVEPVILDRSLAAAYQAVHDASRLSGSRLAYDELSFKMWSLALVRHGGLAPDDVRTSAPPQAMRRVIEHLHDRAGLQVRASDLTAIAGSSERQLYRSFREHTGVSPHRYQLQLRLSMAKRLLAHGTPPAEAAAAAGFVDQSHLSRHFKRLVGVAPGRYRPARGRNVQDGRSRQN